MRSDRGPETAPIVDDTHVEGRCFDAGRADGPTRLVPLARVIDPLVVTHAAERIGDYRRAMAEGARFPPITVVGVAGRYLVADGHKRLAAYRQLDIGSDVLVQVWPWRRWAGDQLGQLRRSMRRQAGATWRSAVDPAARIEGRRVLADLLGHWRRIGQSLWALVRRGRTPAPADARVLLARLLRECAREPLPLAIATVSLVLAAAAQLGLTWVVKLWAEGPVATRSAAGLPLVLAAGGGLTALLVVSLFVARYGLTRVNQGLLLRLRQQVQAHLLGLEVSVLRQHAVGDLVARAIADAGQLAGVVRDLFHRLVGESLVVAGALAMLVYLNWRLALAAALLGPPVALLLATVGRRIRRRAAVAQQTLGALSATLTEQLHGVRTVKTFQAEANERDRFARVNARHRDAVLHAEAWSALLVSGVWLLTSGVLLAVIGTGTGSVVAGDLSPAALVAFCLYAAQTVEPLRRLSELQGLLQRTLAAAARVYEAIDFPGGEAPGGLSLPAPVRGELRCRDVAFAYRAGEPVLDGFHLHVAAGEAIALVGASGAGKSTLAQLLLRFAAPQRGALLLDDLDVQSIALADLRRAVCLVEQEPMIFAGALLDNLRYGSWDAPPSAIEAAVELAQLRPLVAALPGGLHATLAEAGRSLSGGERQRIALARAIVRDPAVLILDEATSALDSDTEARLLDRLAPWLARRTVLVVAHRLSTAARLPRVVVLEAGRVVADGPSARLAESSAAFRRLFGDQLATSRSMSGGPSAELVPPVTRR